MTMKKPTVSVIMANYNGGKHLELAIKSILNQTFTDFEFIIVDDCSTENDYEYISAIDDERIVCLQNESNLGQTRSLNKALSLAKGRYIARMDSDDVSLPARLGLQVDFLEKNQDIMLLGGQANLIDEAGLNIGKIERPCGSDSVWAYSLLSNPFVHASIMFRSSLYFEHNYSYNVNYVNQDFDLWSRALVKFKGANLRNVILNYRQHSASMTYQYYDQNIESTAEIIQKRLQEENLNTSITAENILSILKYFFVERRYADSQGVDRLELAKRYWDFTKDIKKQDKKIDEFCVFAVFRVLQSGVYPSGMHRIFSRLFFLLRIGIEGRKEVFHLILQRLFGYLKGSKYV